MTKSEKAKLDICIKMYMVTTDTSKDLLLGSELLRKSLSKYAKEALELNYELSEVEENVYKILNGGL